MEEKILELLEARDFRQLRQLYSETESADIALCFAELPEDKLPLLFRLLPKDLASEVFVEMDSDMQKLLIASFSDRELKEVIDDMYVDDTVDIIEEMPSNLVKRILANTSSEMRGQINEILKYPKDSAGSVMTVEFVDFKSAMSVSEAFEHLRRTGIDKETIYTCYVTDASRHLLGVLTVMQLIMASPDDTVGGIMDTNVVSMHTTDDREDVAKALGKYDFLAMPITDAEGRLVGIVTIDDAVDVMEDETTEDIEKMAAITPSDDSYFRTGVFAHAKLRIPWLTVLMLSATFTGAIITNYEAAFDSVPLLVAFIPMIMGTAGNAGSQSSTLVIRNMATGDVRLRDFLKVLWKELRIAFSVGVCLALINTVRILIQYRGEPNCIGIALTLAVTIILTVSFSKMLGSMLPMIAKALKLDPALMASPLIATISDTCSTLIFFYVAVRVLGLGG